MEKYIMVRTDFWRDPVILEEMNWEERYFYAYLLTNQQTTQDGIYHVTMEQMAEQLSFSMESVQSLVKRFILHFKLITYNFETSELTVTNWGKYTKYKDEGLDLTAEEE